ncbi:hypothetical protein Trydic_g11836 [Trypoxylus dichotomus]
MGLTIAQLQAILTKAESDPRLLQKNVDYLWEELADTLNKPVNNTPVVNAMELKKAFQSWTGVTKKRNETRRSSELTPEEHRFVALCNRANMSLKINKRVPNKIKKEDVKEMPEKRSHDPEPATSSSCPTTIASNEYDVFLKYVKFHRDVLTEDTERKIEDWKYLASVLEEGQKCKVQKRDYIGWNKYFETWIDEVTNKDESELNSREKEILGIWSKVWSRKLDTELKRSFKYLDVKKSVDELKRFNDTLKKTPIDSRRISYLRVVNVLK